MIVVIEQSNPGTYPAYWKCRCDCGKECVVDGSNIRRGYQKSCGCNRAAFRKVKYLNPVLYEVWKGMKARCRDKKHASYKRYGGRGISVCDQWVKSFRCFYEWAINNGYEPDLTLDRFPNIDGNYEPFNCRWVTHAVNSRASTQAKLRWRLLIRLGCRRSLLVS